ncbi:HAUS augmin-like complex subunit 6 N-terminus-domain-containing [Pyrenophora seminiperda CCB06]|uniref:HAUS augmin-like complex subunit 6 N-terminus-domain-containing n=1 Tax=Pyrenophora seminiperda CCB06 TaxID=1302712 RepID=A0A3M7MGQ0_9PLEO|nr:HAUS augmin-like complex subunit 6 N-terminus-domain-containing [Pyrenophora seminiperda CCB06]
MSPVNSIAVSDIKIFVTNLRLLDFDLCQDWPGITVQTFSGKNADQRQRIGGTEWALFRLFEIWDPNDTAQKLQPFFPPLEPLQSLNLRAALYRCLNELKKNGVLGRESVLRKTMLDECKGDKFYEIIAIFSNAVLKKVLAGREQGLEDMAVARKLATATMLSADQQRSLLPLAIAHKAALLNVLKQKEEKRRRYVEFQQLLDNKAADINSRIRKCKDTPRAKRPAVPPKEAEAVKKQLKDNWIGNQKWLHVMLHGENVQAEDAFLNSRFDKVWHMVEKGVKLEQVAAEAGLLENLQSRVQEQQKRLQTWKAFHEELRGEETEKNESTNDKGAAATVKEFKFDHHSQYQLPSKEPIDVKSRRPAMRTRYRDILSEMEDELENASKARVNPVATIIPRRRVSPKKPPPPVPNRSKKPSLSNSFPASPTSPAVPPKPHLQSRQHSFENVPVLPRPSRHVPAAVATPPIDSDATVVPSTGPPVSHPVESPAGTPPPTSSDPIDDTNATDETLLPPQQEASPEATIPEEPPSRPIPTFNPPVLSAEEALADQILHSIGAATPSPVKKPQPRMSLSLMERTRLTMARTNSFEPEPAVPESPEMPSLPSMGPPMLPDTDADQQQQPPPPSLLERTRLSMLATQTQAQAQTHRPAPPITTTSDHHDHARSSLFPVNQFDTPPRSRHSLSRRKDDDNEGDNDDADADADTEDIERTPTEQLFSDEVDYDRVFKSRPRIATSPVWTTPGKDGDEAEDRGEEEEEVVEEVTGIDLGDVDCESDGEGDGASLAWMESPSRGRGR